MKYYLFGSYLHDPQRARDIDLVFDSDDFQADWQRQRPLLEGLCHRTGKPIDLFLTWQEGQLNDCALYTGKTPELSTEWGSRIVGSWRFDQRFLGEDFFHEAKEVRLEDL